MTAPALTFQKATKKASKGRIALDGPSGGGKTYTALLIATVLGNSTALIDTEHRSASKYADLFNFDTLALDRYSPQILIDALAAAAANAYEVVIVDSLSHFWMGTEGMLEQVDRAAKREGGHGMSGWKAMRPVERRMVEALLAYPGHVICTLRVKTDWVEGENARGKRQMIKVGTKAEQREGLEYEFDLVGSLDLANELTVVKSRCPALSGEIVAKPGIEFAETFKRWLDDGEAQPTAADIRDQVLADKDATYEDLLAVYRKAEGLGLLLAPIVTDTGDTSSLGEFIKARGQEARARAEQARRAAEAVPEARPTEAREEQVKRRTARMFALFNELGYSGDGQRTNRIRIYSTVLKREVASTKDLSLEDIERVIETLEARQREMQGVAA